MVTELRCVHTSLVGMVGHRPTSADIVARVEAMPTFVRRRRPMHTTLVWTHLKSVLNCNTISSLKPTVSILFSTLTGTCENDAPGKVNDQVSTLRRDFLGQTDMFSPWKNTTRWNDWIGKTIQVFFLWAAFRKSLSHAAAREGSSPTAPRESVRVMQREFL